MTGWRRKLSVEGKDYSRLSGMLGLAMRAGRLTLGTEQVIEKMRGRKKPYLVLVSEGASEGARKKIGFKCEFYKIRCLMLPIDMSELGRLLGKTYAPVCIGVDDEGFARELVRLAETENSN